MKRRRPKNWKTPTGGNWREFVTLLQFEDFKAVLQAADSIQDSPSKWARRLLLREAYTILGDVEKVAWIDSGGLDKPRKPLEGSGAQKKGSPRGEPQEDSGSEEA